MDGFRHQALEEFADQQVRFAPPPRRLEQLARAEKLLAEIDAEKEYPYQYVCFRITEFRPETYPGLVLGGADLEHDLGLVIAKLARSLPAMPVESLNEPVYSL